MTLGELRPFISTKIAALNLKEWTDGFNTANIPANILDGAFHVEIGSGISGSASQLVHEFRVPFTVRVFFKGFRNPADAKDKALTRANDVLTALLKPTVRLGGVDNLKDIRPVSLTPVPLASSNDNSLILELVFEAVLNYRFA